MEKTLILRNKPFYTSWFLDILRNLVAEPGRIDRRITRIQQKQERYLQSLFRVGGIEPHRNATPESRVFQAHLQGLSGAFAKVGSFAGKYPQLASSTLHDARWIGVVSGWANVLAEQAAASCNTQSADVSDAFDDATRCVDAWLAYDAAIYALQEAVDDLTDCRFQNSNPPIDTAPDDDGPFSGDPPPDPCVTQAMDVVLAENNVNAAWDDIMVWC